MNVFAAELGLPLNDLSLCWDIIQNDHTRVVDLPTANDKYFVQLAGVGLDAQAVQETSATLKRNFGPLSYLISAAQIAGRKPPKLFIESEDSSVLEGSFVLVGNGRRYGGPFPFFKQAVLNDGLLDLAGSRCAAGSSMSSSGASRKNARARAIFCRWPADSRSPRSPKGAW